MQATKRSTWPVLWAIWNWRSLAFRLNQGFIFFWKALFLTSENKFKWRTAKRRSGVRPTESHQSQQWLVHRPYYRRHIGPINRQRSGRHHSLKAKCATRRTSSGWLGIAFGLAGQLHGSCYSTGRMGQVQVTRSSTRSHSPLSCQSGPLLTTLIKSKKPKSVPKPLCSYCA